MRIALMIEGQEGVSWDDWVALGAAVDRLGFDALFRSDHYVSVLGHEDRDVLDAWGTIHALAAITERVRLGTLVSPATFRHPAVLAKLAATADHVSGGRIELGMGAGWNEREHAAYGFPFPEVGERFDRFAEQVEVVRRLLTEPEVDHDGAWYRLDRVRPRPAPVQATLPLVIGGDAGPRSTRLAARWADEYNTFAADLDDVRVRRHRIDAAWEAAGRDPATVRLSLMSGVLVGDSPAALEARAARAIERIGIDADPKDFLEQRRGRWLVGSPDEIVDQLRERAEAGVTRVMLQLLDHRDLDAVALLGERVVPAFHA